MVVTFASDLTLAEIDEFYNENKHLIINAEIIG